MTHHIKYGPLVHSVRRLQYGSVDRSMMALSSGSAGSRRRSRSALLRARYALDAAAWAVLMSGCLRGRPRGRRGRGAGSIMSIVPGSFGSLAITATSCAGRRTYYIWRVIQKQVFIYDASYKTERAETPVNAGLSASEEEFCPESAVLFSPRGGAAARTP